MNQISETLFAVVQPQELRPHRRFGHRYQFYAQRFAGKNRVAHDIRPATTAHQVIGRDRADVPDMPHCVGRHKRDDAGDPNQLVEPPFISHQLTKQNLNRRRLGASRLCSRRLQMPHGRRQLPRLSTRRGVRPQCDHHTLCAKHANVQSARHDSDGRRMRVRWLFQ